MRAASKDAISVIELLFSMFRSTGEIEMDRVLVCVVVGEKSDRRRWNRVIKRTDILLSMHFGTEERLSFTILATNKPLVADTNGSNRTVCLINPGLYFTPNILNGIVRALKKITSLSKRTLEKCLFCGNVKNPMI